MNPRQLRESKSRLEANLNNAMKGTCEWIFHDAAYVQWLTLSTPSELWIYGPPGTGKSVLLSAVINHLQRHGHTTIYFFNSIGEQDSTAPIILASLIQQMMSLMP